ncbi:MAG: tryptophan 2,3-dioxygenase [Acidobacteria bacterium]|nr:MAG: tryptophan 2,3-dioxygenase [Acidobacteriota bacterium]
MPMTYDRYLALDELLSAQRPQSSPEEHDELLFIIIHQAYELWFKLLLHELAKVRADLSGGELWGAVHTLKRCRTVMKTLVGQLDILETMTPMSFLSFRDRLDTASGFQSVQFRELEFVLGYRSPQRAAILAEGTPGRARLERLLGEPSVYDAFYRFLREQGFAVPDDLLGRDLAEPVAPDERFQDALLAAYRERPDLAILFELMTDLDEGLQEWRYRHVKMVERTIGDRVGTGGSPGVAFLRGTLFKPVFPDLWAIRNRL